MPGERRLEIRDASGKIAGIEVSLNARLIGYQQDGRKPPEDSNIGKRREFLAQVIDELEKWHFDGNTPAGDRHRPSRATSTTAPRSPPR